MNTGIPQKSAKNHGMGLAFSLLAAIPRARSVCKMRKLLLTATVLAAMPMVANATLIASFSQNQSATPTVVATDNGVTTNITVSSKSASITAGDGAILGNALFSLNATSIDVATTLGTAVIQHYSGTFCFSSVAGCGGTNFLSGTFTDAAFGGLGGPGLNVNVNNPPDTLVLTSSVIPANQLGAPSTFGLTFANLTPALHITSAGIGAATIGAFTADFSGTVSASEIPEPMSIGILGLGLLGLGYMKRKSNA